MLTECQKNTVKRYLINSNNKLFGVFPLFSPLNLEFNPGSKIVDIFPNQVSFNLANKVKSDKLCFQQLDDITLHLSSSPHMAIIVTDASIKNDIATLVSHIHICNHPLIKIVHYVAFITSTEVELFAMRYGISQACSKENISKIIVITDSIHVAKKIFDDKTHPYQIHTIAILSKFWQFLLHAKKIPSNFGNALANSSGDFTDLLTKIQNCSIPSLYSQVKYSGTIAKNLIVTTSPICGKWHSKHWMEKVDTSSISLITTSKTLNCLTSKGAHNSNPLVILTHYVLKLQEPLQTTSQ